MIVTISERITKGRLFHENEIEIHQDRILMLCCLYLVARLRRKESEERNLKNHTIGIIFEVVQYC